MRLQKVFAWVLIAMIAWGVYQFIIRDVFVMLFVILLFAVAIFIGEPGDHSKKSDQEDSD